MELFGDPDGFRQFMELLPPNGGPMAPDPLTPEELADLEYDAKERGRLSCGEIAEPDDKIED